MRLLVDNALSPVVALQLSETGYDVLHVRDIGMAASKDIDILEFARQEGRVIVSADTDFGTLLTLRQLPKPSFVLLRGQVERKPPDQAKLLALELPQLETVLAAGAIVVISRDRVRVRPLPIRSG